MFGVVLIARAIEISKYEFLGHFEYISGLVRSSETENTAILCPSFHYGCRTLGTDIPGR